MSEQELKKALAMALLKMAKKVGVDVFAGFNLTTARKIKRQKAQKNGWTLFINKKGSLCHAIYKKGGILILESPEDKHDLFYEEHAINYFVNIVKEMSNSFKEAEA